MAQLWGGRFTKETDKLVYNFNASLSFDSKLYKQDITGSMAHASMLAKQGIIEEQEKEEILKGLKSILEDIENKKLEFTEEYEDIHSFVEANLIDRCGDVGKKLHTGRSRNDQVALDMKMYVRDEIGEIDLLLKELLTSIYKIMSENVHTYMHAKPYMIKCIRLLAAAGRGYRQKVHTLYIPICLHEKVYTLYIHINAINTGKSLHFCRQNIRNIMECRWQTESKRGGNFKEQNVYQ